MELAQSFLIRYAECYVLIRFNFAAAVINTFVSSKTGEKLNFGPRASRRAAALSLNLKVNI